MKCNAQLHFEMLICTAILFALIAMAVATINALKEANERNSEMLIAEAKAQKCSLFADTLFSNAGGSIAAAEQCYAGTQHEVMGSFNGEEKSAFSIAPNISSNQVGDKTVLEVATDEHYS